MLSRYAGCQSVGARVQPITSSKREVVCYEVLSYFSNRSGDFISPPSIFSAMTKEDMNKHTILLAKLATEKIEKSISLNVFGYQLEDSVFVEELCQILRGGDVVELVEQYPVFIGERLIKALESLSESGIHIALDDFGSGHFNFGLLAFEGVKYLKIDMLFFQNICSSEQSLLILQGLVKSFQCYDVQMIVEGIESQADLELCQSAGVHFFQGYHLGKPCIIS